jgi:undecaprenyl diphosphate synthase
LSINYGGRDEIVRAVRRCIEARDEISEETISRRLDQPDMPDPDLIIRSGNERRLSNFLLWEAAYAELYFSAKLWPDWDRDDLFGALEDYAQRSRRFGGAT